MGGKKIRNKSRQLEYRGSAVSTHTKCLRYIPMTGPCEPALRVHVFSHRGPLTSSPVTTPLRSHTMYLQYPHYTDQWFRNTGEETTW